MRKTAITLVILIISLSVFSQENELEKIIKRDFSSCILDSAIESFWKNRTIQMLIIEPSPEFKQESNQFNKEMNSLLISNSYFELLLKENEDDSQNIKEWREANREFINEVISALEANRVKMMELDKEEIIKIIKKKK